MPRDSALRRLQMTDDRNIVWRKRNTGVCQMKNIKRLLIALLLILPVVLVCVFDPACTRSARNLCFNICAAVFFFDLPLCMCLLHFFHPQRFRNPRTGRLSIVPWAILFFLSWAIVALEMFFATRSGDYPDNGFSVVCAYYLGWAYIWFTMIPVWLLYLGIRLAGKDWPGGSRNKPEKEG